MINDLAIWCRYLIAQRTIIGWNRNYSAQFGKRGYVNRHLDHISPAVQQSGDQGNQGFYISCLKLKSLDFSFVSLVNSFQESNDQRSGSKIKPIQTIPATIIH